MSKILSREEFTKRMTASIFGTPAEEVYVMCDHDAAQRAEIKRLKTELAAMKEGGRNAD